KGTPVRNKIPSC
ncbi:putative inner membrane protein, partial [Chlamydia psittaci 06-1683]